MSARGLLAERMGIEIVEAGPDRVIATMPAEGNLQPHGIVHGGAYCALGETVGSIAANLHAGDGAYAVGIDLNATHHRSVAEGTVTATATALSLGRTICSHQVEIRDDTGRLVSTVRITNLIRRTTAEPARPARPELTSGADSIDLGAQEIERDSISGDIETAGFDSLAIGVWEHGAGTSTDTEVDEIAVVLSGSGHVEREDGTFTELRPGVLIRLQEGEKTMWTITEALRKVYLVRR